MIPEEKKRHKLTQEDCDTVRLLLARRRTLKEIADIIDVDPSTVGKIRVADYNLEKYLEQRKAMNRKTKERKAEELRKRRIVPLDKLTDPREWKRDVEEVLKNQGWDELQKKLPEVPGQMKMDLEPVEEPEKKEPDEQTKQMRFQAALMDKLLRKLDELIDVLKGGGKDE